MKPPAIAAAFDTIKKTFPPDCRQDDKVRAFVEAAQVAVERYVAVLPIGAKTRRQHRKQLHPRRAARPNDPFRHGLIGDLYEAYMTARGDKPNLHGFKRTADAVLKAAALREVSEREQTYIREQIKEFAALI
jgi:hypothetical protein